jgi:hypothetical protein
VKKNDYLWFEMKSKHKLLGEFDHYLTPWPHFDSLECLLEQVDAGEAVEVKITVLRMTDEERAVFCEDKEIEWD